MPDYGPDEVGAPGVLDALGTVDYSELSPRHKLALLRCAVNAYLDVAEWGPVVDRRPVHEWLVDNLEKHKELWRERRDVEASIRRDYGAAIQAIEGRKQKRIVEATMTVSSEALAASMAANGLGREMAASSRLSSTLKAPTATMAAVAAAALLPTVPYATAPPEMRTTEANDEGVEPESGVNGHGGDVRIDSPVLTSRAVPEYAKGRSAATDALLAAIESRDAKELKRAIDLAECSGHEGEYTDGRPWRTEEIKAAHKVLAEVIAFDEKNREATKEAQKMQRAFHDYLRKTAQLPTKEEPLGSDASGRLYWYFLHDPHKLYVQAPTPSPSAPMLGCSAAATLDPCSASKATPTYQGWRWAYYDAIASVRDVYASLDANGCAREQRLKANLRERLGFIELFMTTDCNKAVKKNEDAGWLEEGHEYIGLPMMRIGVQGDALKYVSTCKVTRWLPPVTAVVDDLRERVAEAEEMLFHAVHDDGDEEDLEEHEARAARQLYLDVVANGGEVPHAAIVAARRAAVTAAAAVGETPEDVGYVNKAERRASARATTSSLGVVGLREEILSLEDLVADGLHKNGSPWGTNGGGRSSWLLSCRESTSVVELAQLLALLEASVHDLQRLPDVNERKPWRTEGHEFIGQSARRFFPGVGASDGSISGWLPPEGDDPALWHMVHGDDDDEEDLDETEALFAIESYSANRLEPTAEESAYLAKFQTESAVDGVDDNGDYGVDDDAEDDDEADQPQEGRSMGAVTSKRSGGRDRHGSGSGGVSSVRKRLWWSAESRERWLNALQGTPSIAMVGLAAVALRQHCQGFGLFIGSAREAKVLPKGSRDDMEVQLQSWCWAGAFGVVKPHQSRAKLKKKVKKAGRW